MIDGGICEEKLKVEFARMPESKHIMEMSVEESDKKTVFLHTGGLNKTSFAKSTVQVISSI